jgi:3-oxoadipate enol-lactonase
VPHVTRDDGVKIYWEEAVVLPPTNESVVVQAFRPAVSNGPEGPHYLSANSAVKQPLLLIMGLGATLEWWRRLIPILSSRYRTIVYDNRGVGRSDVPAGPYSIPAMAEDAAAVMDAAGMTSAHVFGASMGGMIAQELALNHPSRVRSLILGCTACGGTQVVPAAKEVGIALGARKTMTREQAMWTMAPYIFDAGTPRERVAEDIAVRLAATVSNDGYFAQLAAIRAWSGTHDRLGGLAMPTLVIHGETDQLVPPENGRIVAKAIPHARLAMIPNASHIFFTDQLDASTGALLSFLETA